VEDLNANFPAAFHINCGSILHSLRDMIMERIKDGGRTNHCISGPLGGQEKGKVYRIRVPRKTTRLLRCATASFIDPPLMGCRRCRCVSGC